MWPTFGSISMREVIITSILYGFDKKNLFFREVLLAQVQWFGTGTRCGLETLHQRGKKVKTTNQKGFGANSYVCRSYRGKSVWEHLFASPILNRANGFFSFKFHDKGAHLDDLKQLDLFSCWNYHVSWRSFNIPSNWIYVTNSHEQPMKICS